MSRTGRASYWALKMVRAADAKEEVGMGNPAMEENALPTWQTSDHAYPETSMPRKPEF